MEGGFLVRKVSTQKPAMAESPPVSGSGRDLGAKVLCPRCKEENDSSAESCGRCGFSFLETRASGPQAAGRALAPGREDGPFPRRDGLVGQVINGKYKVLSLLGEGGFGVVYKVELLLFDTGNIFALKLLRPSLSQDKNFRRRFLREAGLAMALIHENTIQIREFGQMDDGHLFFTMDYCEGEPLKTVITREGYINVNRALHITRQILSVMKLAHARGVIHRDLKPENIFLQRDSQNRDFVKVGDFGLAKSFGSGDDVSPIPGRAAWRAVGLQGGDITRGGIVGTPRYMSPEQAAGKDDIDDRSDIYSIGVLLYEMLYGHVPAERVSPNGPSPWLQTPASPPDHSVPRAVWEVSRKAIALDREDRFQSAEEFLEAINSLPYYTPTYMEPTASQPRRLIRWAPVLLVLGVTVLFFLCLQGVITFPWLPMEAPPKGITLRPASLRSSLETHDSAASSGRSKGLEGQDKSTDKSTASSIGAAAFSTTIAPALQERISVRDYFPFQKNDVLHFEIYREGLVSAERKVSYHIEEVLPSGDFKVKVTPGDRTLVWMFKENALYQEVTVPDKETGELKPVRRRLEFLLPPPDLPLSRDSYKSEDGLLVHREPVTLKVAAPHPRISDFTGCLLVEWKEGHRVHKYYYQKTHGQVGIEVFDEEKKVLVFARYLADYKLQAEEEAKRQKN
jgi:serine/threonine protein kinase